MEAADLGALWLSFKLALTTTLILLVLCVPVAWWLAHTHSRIKPLIETIVAMPVVLPPTVIGFYLLILLGPEGGLGAFWVSMTGEVLSFSFWGLVIASVIYSLPFVMQPLQSAFESVSKATMEAAATLGASPRDAFCSVAVPLARRGFVTAIVMGIAHTMGEFGVVLMVGGNIPGETRLVSIAIYDHVETLDYASAHSLSAVLLGLSFITLLAMYLLNRRAVYRVA